MGTLGYHSYGCPGYFGLPLGLPFVLWVTIATVALGTLGYRWGYHLYFGLPLVLPWVFFVTSKPVAIVTQILMFYLQR